MIAGGARDRRMVLVVEDDRGHAELIHRAFREAPGFEVSVATDLATGKACLADSKPDLALVDYLLPDGSGIELLPPAGQQPAIPMVIMTSHGSEEVAVDAMKRGAIDYIVKTDESLPRLPEVARRVLREHQLTQERERAREAERRALAEVTRLRDELERERDYLREEVKVAWQHGQIIGSSSALQQVMQRIDLVAPTDALVLIEGESGVGKELVARAIHERSPRRDQTMVKVNCASIPRELFESEFFGHVRGAFTGAHRDRAGRFELARGGTIFLDEVGEIPPELQVKLLRVIQEGEYERVGDSRTRKTDVRVLVATNRDLKSLVESGQFRDDLYYRLAVFPIEVPPLRDRPEDVLPLARHFLALAAEQFERRDLVLTKYQADTLTAYDWPGNVRELRNVVERAVLLSRGSRLRLDLALPESQARPSSSSPATGSATGARLFLTAAEFKQKERRNLIAALEQASWKVAGPRGAAALLGLKPSTLESKIKAMRIRKPARKPGKGAA